MCVFFLTAKQVSELFRVGDHAPWPGVPSNPGSCSHPSPSTNVGIPTKLRFKEEVKIKRFYPPQEAATGGLNMLYSRDL